jgi:hypothetical protein
MTAITAVHRKLGFAFVLAMGVASPRFVSAQTTSDSVTAQALFDDARDLMAKGRYAQACPKLEESQRLDPGSGTLLNLAACYEHEGRTASAWTKFLEAAAAAQAGGNAERASAARERAAALAPRLARITIRVTDVETAGLEVRRDGAIVSAAQQGTAIPVDPGAHTVVATVPGKPPWQRTITLQEGATATVVVPEFDVEPPGSTKPDVPVTKPDVPATKPDVGATSAQPSSDDGLGTQRILALTSGGLGVAGLVVGSVFGLRAKSFREDSQEHCDDNACRNQDGANVLRRSIRAGNVSSGAFAIGAVGLAAGALLWFTAPAPNLQVGAGVGTLQIRGTW